MIHIYICTYIYHQLSYKIADIHMVFSNILSISCPSSYPLLLFIFPSISLLKPPSPSFLPVPFLSPVFYSHFFLGPFFSLPINGSFIVFCILQVLQN